MPGFLRRVGIAIGSLVAGFLVVWLVGGVIGLHGVGQGGIALAAAALLGGLVYRDILRRERHSA